MPRPGYDTTDTHKTASYTNMSAPILRDRPPPDAMPPQTAMGRMNILARENQGRRSRDGSRDRAEIPRSRSRGSRKIHEIQRNQ
ncbi:uncharacterized protein PG998_014808 [Apiospora kogelbergensis]|uniref:uncharacterized protein n=1 Tax=Apiospora kogelbergensis TaxID=1337665 RepID=UPI00312D046F